jgi:short-subunit dehydrogenase
LKSIIITGASSGIGREASIRLAKSGYRVYGVARSQDKLEELASELPIDRFIPVQLDITQYDALVATVKGIAARDNIYGLVNNAGYVEPGAIEDISLPALRAQFETNFFSLAGITKQVLPVLMQKKEGRIVNVSSMAGMVSLPLIGAYCAAKHAVDAFSDALAMELWNTGIKVVSINPGVVETNIHTVTRSKIEILSKSRFAKAYVKYLEHVPRGLHAGVVADAIFEAIGSQNPKLRYVLGSSREKAGIRIKPFIPERLFFSLVAKRLT